MAPPIVPLVVATALFMENTDATILSTALPTIARDLGLDPLSLKLAVTSYLVSLAVFIPVSGWVADRVGVLHHLPRWRSPSSWSRRSAAPSRIRSGSSCSGGRCRGWAGP